jgi:hypothetical protein
MLLLSYLMNDQKISAIGRYIRHTLVEKIQGKTGHLDMEDLLGWEAAHRSDPHRGRRKIEQLIIDQITFVASGTIALVSFWVLVPMSHICLQLLSGSELVLLLFLSWEIIVYADLAQGR